MNAAASRLAPSITTLIRMDHSHVLAIAHRYRVDASESKKRALVTNTCIAKQVHAQLEEEIFYPRMRDVLPGDEALQRSDGEHQQMKDLINELRERCAGSEPLDQSFDEKFMTLMRIFLHHIAEEETYILPAAERLLGTELSQLGAQMTRRRIELMKPYAGEMAKSAARSFPVGTATGAALLTAGAVALGAMLFSRNRNGRGFGGLQRIGSRRH
ncbi:MAG: hemerythrin domain-containing protein [Gammaproteobacteria bacterium]|nr:cation-binding protein [Gammaproteobacteria bacterium]